MAKKAAKAASKHAEPEGKEAPESLGGGQEGHGFAPGSMSKSEAIRRALAAGFEGPQEGTAYIRKEFGIEIAPGHFSAVKATEKKKGSAPRGKPGRKPKTWQSQKDAPPIEHYFTPSPKSAPAGGDDLIDTLEALKPLVAQLGAEKVKRLVDLLG